MIPKRDCVDRDNCDTVGCVFKHYDEYDYFFNK